MSGYGDPTGTGTGRVFPPIGLSGPGRGSAIEARGGDGEHPPDPPRPVAIHSAVHCASRGSLSRVA